MNMEGNFSTFVEISERSSNGGEWVVIINKKVVASGTAKEIRDKIKTIRKQYPHELPLIAKIPTKAMQIV